MPFFGTYEHSIDAKGRIAIPSDMRRQIQAGTSSVNPQAGSGKGSDGDADEPTRLYVVPYKREALSIYTEKAYFDLSNDLQESDLSDEDFEEYQLMLYSLTRPVELDKAGRVRLPDDLRAMVNVTASDAVLIGAGDHMEVRDRATWYAKRKGVLDGKPDVMVNPRMRRKRMARQEPG